MVYPVLCFAGGALSMDSMQGPLKLQAAQSLSFQSCCVMTSMSMTLWVIDIFLQQGTQFRKIYRLLLEGSWELSN